MRINNECVRKVLKEIELLPFGESITVSKLAEKMMEFSIEDVIYTVTFLNRERFIMVLDKPGYDDNEVFRDNKVKYLTERGYRSLDLIRDDNIWNEIKEKLLDFNEVSFFTILVVASKLYNKTHNQLFGFLDNYYDDYSKW